MMGIAKITKNISEIINQWPVLDASFGRVVYSPLGTYGPIHQPWPQLVTIESATATVHVDQHHHRLVAGETCLLLPHTQVFIEYAKKQKTEHTWCTLLLEKTSSQFIFDNSQWPDKLSANAPINQVMKLGLSAMGSDLFSDQQFRVLLGKAMFQAYLSASQMSQIKAYQQLPYPVLLAQEYITSHLHLAIKLDDLAHAAKVTPNHLVRLFREHVGLTPSRYLWKRRTDQGVSLLRNTGMYISEIAYQVGFSTPFHFSRLVRQHYGQSPRDLRHDYWQGKRH